MKKTIYFLAIFALMSACTSGKQKTDNNEQQTAETTTAELTETNMEKRADISYTQCPLAYLVDGGLYFHNVDNNINVKFVEEPDNILNVAFDPDGKTMYYSVERDNTLWLKAADISDSQVSPQWVVDWNLKEDNEVENGYSNSLLFHKGELLLEHDFHIGYYSFRKFDIYSIPNHKKITREMDSDGELTKKFRVEVPNDKDFEYFDTTKEQLYYTRNNGKVSLTDKLNINSLKTADDIEVGFPTEYNCYTLSPDETKILFKVMLGYDEGTFHGPYCIANADGSNQQILEQADQSYAIRPKWLKDNSIIFTNREKDLFVTNNEDSSVQKIAENVSTYVSR